MVFLLLCVLTVVNGLTLRTVDDEDIIFYWKGSKGHPCLPFTSFPQHCNHCVCGADGVPYCTKFTCAKHNDDLVDPSTVIKSTTVDTTEIKRDFHGNRIYTSDSEAYE